MITWTDELVALLLNCIVVKGAHICGGKKVSQTWNEVNEMFFAQGETQHLRATNYKKDDYRKLRDKFKAVIPAIERDIESGNQSGKEGELSKSYKLAKQIIEEIEAKESDKEAQTVLKTKLNDTEKTILESCGPLKRKMLNGEIVDNTVKRERKTPASFMERLLNFADPPKKKEKKEKLKIKEAAEEELEVRFKRWMRESGQDTTLHDLLRTSEVAERNHAAVVDVGLNALISTYFTRGGSFSYKLFRKDLVDMELPVVVARQLYAGLQDWRREFEDSNYYLKPASTVQSSSGGSTVTTAMTEEEGSSASSSKSSCDE